MVTLTTGPDPASAPLGDGASSGHAIAAQDGLLVLSRAEIARLLSFSDYVDAVEGALRAAAAGRATAPPASALHVADGSFHAKAGALVDDGGTVVAIKLNGNFPGNPAAYRLPTVQGVIYLADGRNGRPLALMDSIEVTINRTGAATALAARHLARPDSRIATICGAGVQGRIQAVAVVAAAKLERVHVWDARPEAAVALAAELARELRLDVRASRDLAPVCDSDIVVTCTSARRAFLTRSLIRPGTFVAAIGADNDDKSEIDPTLFASARVVVDSLEQCAKIGDLHHALEAGTVTRGDVDATLAEIVGGGKPGRCDNHEITLFDSTGLGLHDVAAAYAIYRRALAQGFGTRLVLN
ncbi:ornithine cyclodeaminase family protein [Vineibacter terrae]|uniref:Ornithine cyclodeaminase family protein n=1 Tax=Vineibacter terrae TaxID=2586908 RepID=A0A5C8PRL3_9HYPH|nr:ornithine cyclodeaminase family protein [Vineibacter terrae]TXL77645.1 ornithine cyclodeaminase family protein [Vineibacter terrae]